MAVTAQSPPPPMTVSLTRRHQLALLLTDAGVIFLTLVATQKLFYHWLPQPAQTTSFSPLVLGVYTGIAVFSFFQQGLYQTKRSYLLADVAVTIFEALTQTWLLITAISYFTGLYPPLLLLLISWLSANLTMIFYRPPVRNLIYKITEPQGRPTKVLVLGPHDRQEIVTQVMQRHPELNFSLVAMDDTEDGEKFFRKLRKTIDKHHIQFVFDTDPEPAAKADLADRIQRSPTPWHTQYKDLATVFEIFSNKLHSQQFAQILFCELGDIEYYSHYETLKRMTDLVLSALALLVCLPLGIVIALAIKLTSHGPIFFKQERIGKYGESFVIYKFRSMRIEVKKDARKTKGDPRITRVGKIIRKFSLDETPQFLNVIKGDMSLVGPRPEMPFIVARYTPLQRQRLLARPGITGLWQIHGRQQPIHDHIKYDLYYVKNANLLLDLFIIVRTLPAIVSKIGAF